MTKGTSACLVLALLALSPAGAAAQGVQGKWSVSFSASGDLPVSGSAIRAGSLALLGLPT
jgi:hypothetical protein